MFPTKSVTKITYTSCHRRALRHVLLRWRKSIKGHFFVVPSMDMNVVKTSMNKNCQSLRKCMSEKCHVAPPTSRSLDNGLLDSSLAYGICSALFSALVYLDQYVFKRTRACVHRIWFRNPGHAPNSVWLCMHRPCITKHKGFEKRHAIYWTFATKEGPTTNSHVLKNSSGSLLSLGFTSTNIGEYSNLQDHILLGCSLESGGTISSN